MSDERTMIPGTVDWEAARAERAEAERDAARAELAASAHEFAQLRLSATAERDAELAAVGWLYCNPDTGIEFSRQHPVRSGECEDAKNVRKATAYALLTELKQAWEIIEEERTAEAKMGERYARSNSDLYKASAERDAMRALLREARDQLQPISALVDMTPSGFPDHDICPIRLGMARDLRELRARIDAALKKGAENG